MVVVSWFDSDWLDIWLDWRVLLLLLSLLSRVRSTCSRSSVTASRSVSLWSAQVWVRLESVTRKDMARPFSFRIASSSVVSSPT